MRRFRRFNHSACKTVLDTASLPPHLQARSVRNVAVNYRHFSTCWCLTTAVFTAAIASCNINTAFKIILGLLTTRWANFYSQLHHSLITLANRKLSRTMVALLLVLCNLQPSVCNVLRLNGAPYRTRSQAVARIAERTAKNCRGHVTQATPTFREIIVRMLGIPIQRCIPNLKSDLPQVVFEILRSKRIGFTSLTFQSHVTSSVT